MRKKIEPSLLDNLQKELEKKPEKQWHTYSCTLVTPMYGGGVNAGEVDKDMPIRASSIRGQLRFWWRIACGPFADTKVANSKVMRDKEEAIWGGIGCDGTVSSKLQIRISSGKINTTQLQKSSSIQGKGIKYVLGAGDEIDCLQSGYKFDVEISYSDRITAEQIKQIEETIRWWASFGGIGGRTRRGFGAIKISGLKPVEATEMKDSMKLELVSGPNERELFGSAEGAWKEATRRLYTFRQGKNIGRNEGQGNRPGRSRWPEPDQLRRMSGKSKENHEPEHKAGNVFPRAAFGMPIIFDFNDRSKKEPSTMTLLPLGAQRMASPLILRPYYDGEKWYASALLLPNCRYCFGICKVGSGKSVTSS
jgi:CRISPR-associated protein Cmr1